MQTKLAPRIQATVGRPSKNTYNLLFLTIDIYGTVRLCVCTSRHDTSRRGDDVVHAVVAYSFHDNACLAGNYVEMFAPSIR